MIELNWNHWVEYKKLCKVEPKIPTKIFSPNHLHFIPSNPMILKVIQKLFSPNEVYYMHSKREKGTDPKAQFDIVPTLFTQSLFQYIMILFKQKI